jgi:crotonobetainyl-CoA:carnitine CoA-transferase CaiB-like acyl-CoA transferase
MQTLALQGTGLAVDPAAILTKVAGVKEARALPTGAIVGDLHGGLTFSDAVAAALETRSRDGWVEIQAQGQVWTIIVLNR